MAVTIGTSINETHYTTLRSGINTVMGTPTGSGNSSSGYNQSISAPAVGVGTSITASQWNNLRGDIRKASAHQTNSAVALTTVDTDTGITATIHNEFETALATVTSNRFALATGQSTLATARTKTRTQWNSTETHDVQLTWANAPTFKAFWNAGGTVNVVSGLSYTGSEAKTLDWKSLVNDAKHVSINYTSAYANGGGSQGTITNTGMYDLNTNGTEVKIFQDGGTNPYSENDYQVFIRYITNGIRVRVVFRDDDSGDQTGSGAAVDENVKGTLTSAITVRRATGTNVEVTSPSVAVGSTNTFV